MHVSRTDFSLLMGTSLCCDNCQAALQRCGKRSVSNGLALGPC